MPKLLSKYIGMVVVAAVMTVMLAATTTTSAYATDIMGGREAELNRWLEDADIDDADIDGGTINNTIIGGTTPAAGSFTDLNAMNSNATKTDTYVVLTADLGKTLIMNSGDAKIFTTPSVAAGDIGAHLKFIKIGTGMLTIQMADSDTVGDSGAGDTVYCGDTGIATIEIELVSATAWAIISVVNEPSESWITTD